jgi:hypothetical protein
VSRFPAVKAHLSPKIQLDRFSTSRVVNCIISIVNRLPISFRQVGNLGPAITIPPAIEIRRLRSGRLGNFFPAPPKIFFSICENAWDFRIVFVLGEIFPQYTLA